jgi:hypothetical protein
MEYHFIESGILIAEGENGQNQIVDIVDVSSPCEVSEQAANYIAHGPANSLLAPEQFVIIRRDCNGHFTRRETVEL